MEINGHEVGDRVLDPAFTRYDRRVLYSTFDVTNLIGTGANAVGVELGNGWYNHQAKVTWDFDKAPWRARPAFCMDIRICYAERLGTDGCVDQSNINVYYFGDGKTEPFQTDVFTLSGGDDEFCSRYSYKGFRYVEVELGSAIEMGAESLKAVPVHSDVRPMGTLNASAGVVVAIEDAARRAYLSNLMGYPTDCPQREKNGWTGDAHIAIETGLYNYDGITVYEKWLADHRDEQQPNGVLPECWHRSICRRNADRPEPASRVRCRTCGK